MGYRYWLINNKGLLIAPVKSKSVQWSPGLNKRRCTKRCSNGCKGYSCGLYAINGSYKGANNYFDLEKGKTFQDYDEQSVVGAVALWKVSDITNGVIKGIYGAPAALCLPKGGSNYTKQLITQTADLYKLEVVEPENLKDAAKNWVKNTLPDLN